VLTAAALMAAMLVVLSGPAMAQGFFDFDNNDNNGFFDNNDHNGFFDNNGLDNALNFDQETGRTGDVNLNSDIVNTGNNSNQCAAPLQFGNTGNLQNAQGFVQDGGSTPNTNNNFDRFPNRDFFNPFNDSIFNDNNGFFDNGRSSIDDVEFEAPEFTFNPRQNVNCNQAVEQAATASG
jgi:hypothetical protein